MFNSCFMWDKMQTFVTAAAKTNGCHLEGEKRHNLCNNQTSSQGGLSYWPLTKTTFIWLRSTHVIFTLLCKPLSPITQTTSPLGPAVVDSWLLTESELQAKHNHSEQSESRPLTNTRNHFSSSRTKQQRGVVFLQETSLWKCSLQHRK